MTAGRVHNNGAACDGGDKPNCTKDSQELPEAVAKNERNHKITTMQGVSQQSAVEKPKKKDQGRSKLKSRTGRGPGRPPGSLNRSTIARIKAETEAIEAFKRSNPDIPTYTIDELSFTNKVLVLKPELTKNGLLSMNQPEELIMKRESPMKDQITALTPTQNPQINQNIGMQVQPRVPIQYHQRDGSLSGMQYHQQVYPQGYQSDYKPYIGFSRAASSIDLPRPGAPAPVTLPQYQQPNLRNHSRGHYHSVSISNDLVQVQPPSYGNRVSQNFNSLGLNEEVGLKTPQGSPSASSQGFDTPQAYAASELPVTIEREHVKRSSRSSIQSQPRSQNQTQALPKPPSQPKPQAQLQPQPQLQAQAKPHPQHYPQNHPQPHYEPHFESHPQPLPQPPHPGHYRTQSQQFELPLLMTQQLPMQQQRQQHHQQQLTPISQYPYSNTYHQYSNMVPAPPLHGSKTSEGEVNEPVEYPSASTMYTLQVQFEQPFAQQFVASQPQQPIYPQVATPLYQSGSSIQQIPQAQPIQPNQHMQPIQSMPAIQPIPPPQPLQPHYSQPPQLYYRNTSSQSFLQMQSNPQLEVQPQQLPQSLPFQYQEDMNQLYMQQYQRQSLRYPLPDESLNHNLNSHSTNNPNNRPNLYPQKDE